MINNLEEIGSRLPQQNDPQICCLDGDEPQYFLFVEMKPLFSFTTVSRAIMYRFILHYVFNLEYCNQVKYVALFLFVFGLLATSFLRHQKKSDIQKFI